MLALSSAAAADEPVSPRALVDRALVAARSIEDGDRRADALLSVLTALIQLDDRSQARDLSKEIVSIVKPSTGSYVHDEILKRLVGLQAGSRVEALVGETLAGVKAFMAA